MPDYQSSAAGFNATLKEPEGPIEAAVPLESLPEGPIEAAVPLESQRQAIAGSRLETMVNARGLKQAFKPVNLLAASLAMAAITVAAAPEETGRQAGQFVSGFNTAAEGHTLCLNGITDCPLSVSVGELAGRILYKVDKGFKETSTLTTSSNNVPR